MSDRSVIRFALWAAVSTRQQAAEDKISIPEQIKRCAAAGRAKGWKQTAPPYVAKTSRTKYADLTQAEREIPQLRQMLDDAQARKFDVLVCYKLNRFRDLQEQVFRVLGSYGVQLYSVLEPAEIIAPVETFKLWKARTMRVIVTMSMFASQTEMSDIREKYEMGMPARVQRGLPASAPAYGYARLKSDRKAVPVQQAPLVRNIVVMKRLLLEEGYSLRRIAEHLNRRGVPTPRGAKQWYGQTVRQILANPFYAGLVRWGASAVENDLRTGARRRNRDIPQERITYAKGLHIPLWDESVHAQILAALDSRRINYTGRTNNQFTRLLACSVCGAALHRQGNGKRVNGSRLVWKCSQDKTHIAIPHSVMLGIVADELQKQMSRAEPIPPSKKKDLRETEDEIRMVKTQRARLEDIYLTGDIPVESYRARSRALDAQLNELLETQKRGAIRQRETDEIKKTLASVSRNLRGWLENSDPVRANYILRLILERVTVTPAGRVRIVFK